MKDASVSDTLEPFVDHRLRMVVEEGSRVSLYADDTLQLSYQFDESVTDGDLGLGTWNGIAEFDDLHVVEPTTVSTVTATLQHKDLLVSGKAAGELRIVAQGEQAFDIFDGSRLVSSITDVKGRLRLEMEDADDIVTLDLNGLTLRHSVVVDLGVGDDQLSIVNGHLQGHLKIDSGDGDDQVDVAQDVSVRKHVRIRLGDGHDELTLAGQVERSLVVKAGQGDDRVELLAGAAVGQFAKIRLGAGDDEFVNELTGGGCVTVLGGRGQDSFNFGPCTSLATSIDARLGSPNTHDDSHELADSESACQSFVRRRQPSGRPDPWVGITRWPRDVRWEPQESFPAHHLGETRPESRRSLRMVRRVSGVRNASHSDPTMASTSLNRN